MPVMQADMEKSKGWPDDLYLTARIMDAGEAPNDYIVAEVLARASNDKISLAVSDVCNSPADALACLSGLLVHAAEVIRTWDLDEG